MTAANETFRVRAVRSHGADPPRVADVVHWGPIVLDVHEVAHVGTSHTRRQPDGRHRAFDWYELVVSALSGHEYVEANRKLLERGDTTVSVQT